MNFSVQLCNFSQYFTKLHSHYFLFPRVRRNILSVLEKQINSLSWKTINYKSYPESHVHFICYCKLLKGSQACTENLENNS